MERATNEVSAPFRLIAAVLAASPSHAQTLCGDRDGIAARLLTEFAETPVNRGITLGNVLIEVFASRDGETFTMVLSYPDGTSCFMAAGQFWQAVPPNPDAT